MQVFIEIPYSEAVFDIISRFHPDNASNVDTMTDTEYDKLLDIYVKKLDWQYREDAQCWVNKYIEQAGIVVISARSTGNETIQFEIDI